MKTAESIEQQEERKLNQQSQSEQPEPQPPWEPVQPPGLSTIQAQKLAKREFLTIGQTKLNKSGDTRGLHPNSHTSVGNRNAQFAANTLKPFKWKPGQSGHLTGQRPNIDTARNIAKKIFENNQEALYKAYGKAALRGNAYCFEVLANRAYGKLKERIEYEVSEYREVSEKALIDRIQQLESNIDSYRLRGSPRGSILPPQGIEPPPEPPED